MKRFVLLMLTWMIFSSSHGKYCNIVDGDLLHLVCNQEDTQPMHVIKDESVTCGTEEVLRENINTIDISTCTFEDFHLFKNFTTLRFSFFHETKSLQKECFVGMNQLAHIKIGHSKVEVLESAFSDLPNLRQVDIFSNKLNMSELAFKDAHQLKSLTLSDFAMSSLPSGFFCDLNDLEYLNLGHSRFTNLSFVDFTGLEEVRWLNLNMNRITNMSVNSLHILKNLKYLSLGYNYLVNVDSTTFSQLHNLIHLNLEGNQIEQLNTGVFNGLDNLRSLNLCYNYIYSIESGAFSTLRNLKKLDLSNNKLTSLDVHIFDGLVNLQYLSLNDNFLSALNINTFAALNKLIQLDLSSQHRRLETVDLNAFPQFIDLQTKTIIQTSMLQLDDFEKDELLWIKNILSLNQYFDGDISNYQLKFFGNLKTDQIEDHQVDLNSLSQNMPIDSLILGNLNLSKNRITSINIEKIQ